MRISSIWRIFSQKFFKILISRRFFSEKLSQLKNVGTYCSFVSCTAKSVSKYWTWKLMQFKASLPNLSFVSCSVLEREHLELLLVLNECMKLDWLSSSFEWIKTEKKISWPQKYCDLNTWSSYTVWIHTKGLLHFFQTTFSFSSLAQHSLEIFTIP